MSLSVEPSESQHEHGRDPGEIHLSRGDHGGRRSSVVRVDEERVHEPVEIERRAVERDQRSNPEGRNEVQRRSGLVERGPEKKRDRDGKPRHSLEVHATEMQFIGGRGDDMPSERAASAGASQSGPAASEPDLSDDDIPF